MSVHHETIYRFFLSDKQQGGVLYKHLRHQGKNIVNAIDTPNNHTGILNRVGIGKRSGAIVTLDEPISKLRML